MLKALSDNGKDISYFEEQTGKKKNLTWPCSLIQLFPVYFTLSDIAYIIKCRLILLYNNITTGPFLLSWMPEVMQEGRWVLHFSRFFIHNLSPRCLFNLSHDHTIYPTFLRRQRNVFLGSFPPSGWAWMCVDILI